MVETAADAGLLIVWHSRTGAARQLAQAAHAGAVVAGAAGAGGARARLVPAADADPATLRAAAGYLFICPENLGAMSGAMKEMFDRAYYPLLGQLNGRPYATIIAAGSDGRGAEAQIDRIATGWRLRRVAESLIACTHAQDVTAIMAEKSLSRDTIKLARAMGEQLALGIAMGIY